MNRENKRKTLEKGYYKTHACHDTFTCKVCGRPCVPEYAGSNHRNHCPNCLSSLHVDIEPGDRASDCGGIMEPIAVWVRKGGEWAIIHRCKRCGALSSNLFVVPYTKPQEYIRDNAPDVLFTVLMRRSMMRIANRIATRQGCEALITGESLAQVASQTVKALQCTDAAQDLPILRPLIGMDKTEIIETSRHIGTYETSILPYEDCCTIFTPPHPKIRPELAEILEAEAAMPGLAELEAEAAENTERIRIRITDEIEFEG